MTVRSGIGWTANLCTKSGLVEFSAKVLIDATGDANAVALAGFPLNIPEETQPATLSCKASGYHLDDLDIAAISAAMAAASGAVAPAAVLGRLPVLTSSRRGNAEIP